MNLTQTHPELIKQWDFDKNTILPEDVTAGSHKIVWWKCPVFDDHCWESNIQNRAQKGNTCPCCCNRKTVKSNCLQTTHPELAAQWDVQNSISPTEITAGYNKKAWWRCHKNHIWQSAVNARTIRGDGCPYCSGLKATPENNFAVGRHKILEEWDYDLNLITPEKITPNSGKKIWWKCKQNHSWQAAVYNRLSHQQQCPYCAGKKADHTTSLLAKHPELCTEWDYDKNSISPSELLPSSHKKVYWLCKTDSTHAWIASPLNRTIAGSNCPYCNSSAGETVIKNYLSENKIVFSRQYRIPECKNKRALPFDFAIHLSNRIVLVEFQGKQHYEPVDLYGGMKTFLRQQENDDIKRSYCKNNNIELLEIRYDQVKDIPRMIKKCIR